MPTRHRGKGEVWTPGTQGTGGGGWPALAEGLGPTTESVSPSPPWLAAAFRGHARNDLGITKEFVVRTDGSN